jgi:hypothetical protein
MISHKDTNRENKLQISVMIPFCNASDQALKSIRKYAEAMFKNLPGSRYCWICQYPPF